MKRLIFIFIFFNCIAISAFATHMRAGEITYRHISGLTYEATIVTYTYSLSHADRCQLTIQWGDGSSDNLQRNNGPSGPNINGDYCEHLGESVVPNYIQKNTYVGTHTYAGYGNFTISLEDPNRNEGIINIPYSVNVPFYVESELVINPFLGYVDSPVLLNPPIDNACIYEPYIHNPGAYDSDGDSLSYKLIYCRGDGGLNIPGYTYPAANHVFKINPYTGDVDWDSPILEGEYNIAILIEQWRNGIKVGSVTRDMQINVVACDNRPPVIKPISDTCVVAGSLLNINVNATDPDRNNIVLTASGGPFIINNPATFNETTHGSGFTNGLFSWKTNCNNIRKNPYQVYFKATDDGYPVNLVDLKSMNITVVAPAPTNFKAIPSGNNILLTWSPDICKNIIGYRIYRKEGCNDLARSACETGVPDSSAYQLIADVDSSKTQYLDNDNGDGLVLGKTYSYLIVAYFSDGAESYASDFKCAELKKNVPVITNVSVLTTDAVNGSMYIAWSKPNMDSLPAYGPYKYYVYRAINNKSNFRLIDSLTNINDTILKDSLLNTKDSSYNYKVELYNDSTGKHFIIGTTRKASSVFLSISPSDNKLNLSWKAIVPWVNTNYIVYRKNDKTPLYDSIAYVNVPLYSDSGLVNGNSYCYYIKSVGEYPFQGIIHPILNLSQIVCSSPFDNVLPCPPVFSVFPNCDKKENTLIWHLPLGTCDKDVVEFLIYYSPTNHDDLKVIAELKNKKDTIFVHSSIASIAGCYDVRAKDSTGNESKDEHICIDIDSCKMFILPNVFTPNGDGINDLFVPVSTDYVDKLDIQIFNRWGNLVFQTSDKQINWDGKDMNTKLECPEGVYFYVCEIYEISLNGTAKRRLNGYIQILR